MRAIATLLLAATLASACESVTLIWMPHSQRADPLFRFVKDGKAGFIDTRGRIVIPPTLDFFSDSGPVFVDGLASLGISEGPFLNTKGEQTLSSGFYRIWDFSEGLAAAIRQGESNWGYIDPSGRFVIPPRFPSYPHGLVSDFSEGLAAVEVEGKLGYIDTTGKQAIAQRFALASRFHHGLAHVRLSRDTSPYAPKGDYAYIDKTGKRIFTYRR